MTTNVPKDETIAALSEVWTSLDDLLSQLDDEEWSAPTPCPGWDVRAVVAHVIGTESMLAGEPTPDVEIDPAEYVHVRNDIGRINEAWVASAADQSPEELLARLRHLTAARKATLQAMDAAAWAAEGFTPAGTDTYGRFMRIRVFDTWVHEQDIRDAVGRPGGDDGMAARAALDEFGAALGYLIGKKAGAPAGARVAVHLTGAAGRDAYVEVGERAAVVDALSDAPTVSVTMPVGVFARLAAGRCDPGTLRDQVSIEGDQDLGERIAANLAYTI